MAVLPTLLVRPETTKTNIRSEDRITVHDELGLSSEKAVLAIEQIAYRLHHPSTRRFMHDAANLEAAARQVDDNKNVISNEASQREDLYGEEVPGRYGAPAS